MNILISADSTCDLNRELLFAYHIALTPLSVIFGEEAKKDGVECTGADIIAYTARTGRLCSTSAVSVGECEEFFAEQLQKYDYIIHFTISSEMSSCYQNACLAAEAWNGRVLVVDSRSVSSGTGLQVIRAAQDRDRGLSAEEIYQNALKRVEKVCITFALDTLEYMHKGGRCSTVAALGANLLKLKPCIETVNGSMCVGKKYRGNIAKVLKEMIRDHLQGRSDIRTDLMLIPNNFGEGEVLRSVMDELSAVQSFARMEDCPLGATVVCHCGPNTLGIVFEYV